MTKIYEQFDAATKRICAYCVIEGATVIGRVVFVYPREGAGRLYCYAQVWNSAMVRGFATGGGYDKASAAAESAFERLTDDPNTEALAHIARWKASLAKPSGERWDSRLEKAGYVVSGVI
jgi:hypothetical protein